jgi:hypothetical protein
MSWRSFLRMVSALSSIATAIAPSMALSTCSQGGVTAYSATAPSFTPPTPPTTGWFRIGLQLTASQQADILSATGQTVNELWIDSFQELNFMASNVLPMWVYDTGNTITETGSTCGGSAVTSITKPTYTTFSNTAVTRIDITMTRAQSEQIHNYFSVNPSGLRPGVISMYIVNTAYLNHELVSFVGE